MSANSPENMDDWEYRLYARANRLVRLVAMTAPDFVVECERTLIAEAVSKLPPDTRPLGSRPFAHAGRHRDGQRGLRGRVRRTGGYERSPLKAASPSLPVHARKPERESCAVTAIPAPPLCGVPGRLVRPVVRVEPERIFHLRLVGKELRDERVLQLRLLDGHVLAEYRRRYVAMRVPILAVADVDLARIAVVGPSR